MIPERYPPSKVRKEKEEAEERIMQLVRAALDRAKGKNGRE